MSKTVEEILATYAKARSPDRGERPPQAGITYETKPVVGAAMPSPKPCGLGTIHPQPPHSSPGQDMRGGNDTEADTGPATATAVDSALQDFYALKHNERILGRGTPSTSTGDVLAFVHFPDMDTDAHACDGACWGRELKMRLDSAALLATGSEYIKDMLSESQQRNFCARLGFIAECLPPGIHYIIDFTPPDEGEELVSLTAALSLPRMAQLWALAAWYIPDEAMATMAPYSGSNPVPRSACPGHDAACELTGEGSCFRNRASWEPRFPVMGINEKYLPKSRKVSDYCQVRHCALLARLLLAIHGDSQHLVNINPAFRMWTLAQLGISLDLGRVVALSVETWLLAAPNTKFVELCPEGAYQLALGLRIVPVLQAAFKILVSERAVDKASSIRTTNVPGLTWAQRRRDDSGGEIPDAIEYAAQALAARTSDLVATLRRDANLEYLYARSEQLPTWKSLREIGRILKRAAAAPPTDSEGPVAHAADQYDYLVRDLSNAVRNRVDRAYFQQAIGSQGLRIEAERQHYVPSSQRVPIHDLYGTLDDDQKVATRVFWENVLGAEISANSAMRADLWLSFASGLRSILAQELLPTTDLARLNTLYNTVVTLTNKYVLDDFIRGLDKAVDGVCHELLGGELECSAPFPFSLSSHLLLGLTGNELRFLPQWAGGDDDGTGSVFQTPVPPAEEGPVAPGPGYHTGHTMSWSTTDVATTTTSASDMDTPSGVSATYQGAGDGSEAWTFVGDVQRPT